MEIESLHKNLTHLQKKIEDISAEKDSLTQENLKFTEKQRQIEVKLKNSQVKILCCPQWKLHHFCYFFWNWPNVYFLEHRRAEKREQ